jgi:hypothetical protein
MPECTCRGTNPDCFKCGGWGWIGDPIVKDQGKAPVPTGPPAELSSITLYNVKNKTKHITIRKCSYCGNNVTNLDRHIANYHKSKWEEYAKTDKKRKILEYYATVKTYNKSKCCPHCGVKVLNLENHIRFAHLDKKGNLINKSNTTKVARNKKIKLKFFNTTNNKNTLIMCKYCNILINEEVMDLHICNDHKDLLSKRQFNSIKDNIGIKSNLITKNNNLVKCQYCNSMVKEHNLTNHIKKIHNNSPECKTNLVKEVNNKDNIIFKTILYSEKTMDGSKGWHTLRDGGKFGSFPTFDPMDDESFPD